MSKNYDPNLKNVILNNNNKGYNNNISLGESPLLNGHFLDWRDDIIYGLSNRKTTKLNRKYKNSPNKEILEFCKEHAEKHKQNTFGNNVIMLTHPLYLGLSHMDRLVESSQKKEHDKYLIDLMNFLNLIKEDENTQVVVFETAHHYAAATSVLLEENLVNDIIFTEYDSGNPLESRNLRPHREKNIYFGGGYNGRCLEKSIERMSDILFNFPKIWAIKDLVINPPSKGSLIKSFVKGIDSSSVISLEQARERLGLAA